MRCGYNAPINIYKRCRDNQTPSQLHRKIYPDVSTTSNTDTNTDDEPDSESSSDSDTEPVWDLKPPKPATVDPVTLDYVCRQHHYTETEVKKPEPCGLLSKLPCVRKLRENERSICVCADTS
jgi:hypothetical protein